jgi:hypothetical protein
MTDHVERMVYAWFERNEAEVSAEPAEAAAELIAAIHRMLREAENETRRHCEEIAVQTAGQEMGGRVALAIRTAIADSLPRKSLVEIQAPDLHQ